MFRISNLQFIWRLPSYLEKFYPEKNVHIIFSHCFSGNLSGYKANSFYKDFASFRHKLMADIAVWFIKNNFNPELAVKISWMLMNDVKANDKIINDEITKIVRNNDWIREYNLMLKNYIRNINKQNFDYPILIVGFDERHPLVNMLTAEKLENWEIIFFNSNAKPDFIYDDEIIKNRGILLKKPEDWHKNDYAQITGINLIECDSGEEEVRVIKEIFDDNPNASLVAEDTRLLHRLEISSGDFSYNKPAYLDFTVFFLLRILEDGLSQSFLSMFDDKKIEINRLIEQKESIFQDLGKDNLFVDAHLCYFRLFTDVELSEIAINFLSCVKHYVSDTKITSLIEYKTIFSLLVNNVFSRKIGKITSRTSSNFYLDDDVVIISSGECDNNFDFTQLLHVRNIYVVHDRSRSVQDPEWLLKLKVLLSDIRINSYAEKSYSAEESFVFDNSPPLVSLPEIFSATMIEMLVRDPYAFYVRYILKLKPPETEEMSFGVFIHRVLAKCSDCNFDTLLKHGERELAKYWDNVQSRVLWWPKFKEIGRLFVKKNEERLACSSKIETEVKFNFRLLDCTIVITCDRVDYLNDGTIAIIEYKTGALPSIQDIKSGLSPQLLLQGIAASRALKKEVSELAYWQLKPGEIIVKKISDIQGEMNKMIVKLEDLLKNFTAMEFNSTGFYKDYREFFRSEEVLT
ncbi:MAG: PD-(D/E)XK nuclease family protein [Rickettsiaceae bacterium H1]|nr:PD-(D/E)XK nuclease family protein [Rickettsiaceae bacterium H1]